MKQRVLTSVVLAPLILGCCFISTPYPLFLVCLVALTVSFLELRKLLSSPFVLPVLTLASITLPFYAEQTKLRERSEILPWSALFFCVGVLFAWFGSRKGRGHGSVVDLAGLWLSMPLMAILLVHDQYGVGVVNLRTPLLIILAPVWAGDIAAMFVGKAIGRHKLWPSVSPGKSWEGATANVVVAVAAGVGVASLIGRSVPVGALCGFAASVFGQAGDLFESFVKRRSGVKDSGTILPGHGGLLDRIDSLLFAAPVVSLLLAFMPK